MITKSQLCFATSALALSIVCAGITACSGPTDSLIMSSVHVNASAARGKMKELTDQNLVQDEEKITFPPAEDLVKDWEKPDFALFISGRLHGYIEPCGCVGLDRQKGGLLRRHSVQKLLADRGWDLVSIDSGNQVRRKSQQALIKMRTVFLSLCRTMGYHAIGLGPDDILKTSSDDLAQRIIDSIDAENPFMCANIAVLDESLTNRFIIVEAGGKKIGITAILGDEYVEQINDDSIIKESAAEGMQRVIPKLQAENCDLLVCTIHSSPESCIALAKQFPEFDLLVSSGGAGDPKMLPDRIESGDHVTQMIFTGKKGMHIGIVGFYGDRANLKYERVPLDARFTDSEDIKQRFINYQNTLKTLYTSGQLRDVRPRPHPTGATYVGSKACAECHQEEYKIWEKQSGGPHTQATIDLEQNPNNDRMWVQRQYDPECLSCHVTGWNPQEFYPYETGYIDHEKDVHLYGSGCENCHNPGSEHIRVQRLVKDGKLDKRSPEALETNKAVRLRKAVARRSHCMQCHDLDNSPDFLVEGAFKKYWAEIEHGDGKTLKENDEE